MFRFCKTITATSFCVLIAPCGGGGNGTPAASTGSMTNASADSGSANGGSTGSSGATGNTGSTGSGAASSGGGSATVDSGSAGGGTGRSTSGSTGGGSGPAAPASFTATVTQAPADGARYLSGTVRLEVRGSGMRNVELLPENRYVPRLGTFTVAGNGTSAYLDLDTRVIPNGGIKLRISAFDKPAGASDAREVIAMAARTWLIANEDTINSGLGSPAARAIGCLSLGYPYTPMDDSLPVVCLNWTPPPSTPTGQCTNGFDRFYARPGDGRTVTRDGSLVSASFTCNPAAHGGELPPACSCETTYGFY